MNESTRKDLLLDIMDTIGDALSDESMGKTLLSEQLIKKLLKADNFRWLLEVEYWTLVSSSERGAKISLRDKEDNVMATFAPREISTIAIAKAILAIVLDYVNY